ncbi:MFS transporter [Paenarthrobacter sp. DKR-5]|uniref:MFS transporter n=1 Tax=Paenarthrobacter sp. DKR-5 TaxID=2835535 RepID=UPI001BDD2A4B|nr:MFS transporter [Paenarthrobacter sp. DKR-5]MBT1002842.1 MFS transporter [Paenarthrobacter sp. DKR-5]
MTVISELRMRPVVLPRRGWDASVTARLVLAGVVLSVLLVGANLATPVYALLQARLGMTSLGVTVAFSSYVLSLVACLMLAGHWSDHIGRRAALVVAVLIGLGGGLLFANAQSLLMLSAGRALQGAAVALATGASSAALRELMPLRPEWASRFTLLASAGGVAAGPVIGGLLSLLPDPTRLPFLAHTAALSLLLVPLLLLKARPAIKPADAGRAFATLRPRRPSISRTARSSFWMAALVGFVSFAVFGFTLSLAPTYFAGIVHTDSRAVAGLLAALTLGASASSQLLALRGRYLVPAGLAVLAASLLLIPVAGAASSPWLLVAASLAAGFGQGAAFRVVFNEIAGRVEADRHAQVISTVYVITYLGSAVPVIGMGAAATAVGLPTAVLGFAVFMAAACLSLAAAALRLALRPEGA